MEFHILPILAFLYVVVVASSHAAQSPEAYWKSVLPNTPMPKAVKDLLPNGKGGVSVSTGHKWKPVSFETTEQKLALVGIFYGYGAVEDQLLINPNVDIFFLEKDLIKGTQMTLHFIKRTTSTTFLPRQVARKIPFSSDKIPEILNYFSVKHDSKEAEIIKTAVKECEKPEIKGEEKYCATSLESMVDFSTNELGKSVQAVSTEVDKETPLQKYSIAGVEKMTGVKAVVCHMQNYAYAVLYCHKMPTTKAYVVSLVGADGTKAKAVAVCHRDTSAWSPKHLAFQLLKVKPGTVPVCHFLPEDHIVWVPK